MLNGASGLTGKIPSFNKISPIEASLSWNRDVKHAKNNNKEEEMLKRGLNEYCTLSLVFCQITVTHGSLKLYIQKTSYMNLQKEKKKKAMLT